VTFPSASEDAKAIPFTRTEVTIPIDFEVEHYRILGSGQAVELWGQVGDYEVCVCLPRHDPRVAAVLSAARHAPGNTE
jgi:hypothetical protein